MPEPVPHEPPLEPPPRHAGLEFPRDVYLFRHGEVAEAWQGRIYGALDVPLSRAGRRESRRVARSFRNVPFERILSSDLSRARVLARLLAAGTGAPLEVTADLREIERGRWCGRTAEELRAEAPHELDAFMAQSWTWNEYGGESDGQVWARAWPAFVRAAVSGSGPLAVVAHYNVIRVLLARALGIAPPDSFRLRIDLSRVTLLRATNRGWTLARANVCSPT